MSKHTYEMGLLGNCAFLGLVSTDTAVRWLCWPRSDSSFVFGSLLDEAKGGEYSVRPAGGAAFTAHQYYEGNTSVLCTEITTAEGSYRVTDFAPRFAQYERHYKPLMLVRKVEPLAGAPRVRVACRPVGDYGRLALARRRSSNHVAYLGLEEEVRLTTNLPLAYVLDGQDFLLNETKCLVLTYGASLEAPLEKTAEQFLRATLAYRRGWVKSTKHQHRQLPSGAGQRRPPHRQKAGFAKLHRRVAAAGPGLAFPKLPWKGGYSVAMSITNR